MSAGGAVELALLLGGESPEREVSLDSGAGVRAALQTLGERFMVLDPKEQPEWYTELRQKKIRRVFNILHGGSGENGEIRGALNAAGIACTGSNVLGSALAMNKDMAKTLWRMQGLPTADWFLAESPAQAADIARALPPPWFVKPAQGGSSTHTAAVFAPQELGAAIASAGSENSGVLVERLITGAEYTLSVLDNKPLPLIKIVPPGGFYDYHAKYESDETQFFCPCGLPAAREAELAALGMKAFFALRCAHWGRVDFMLDAQGEPQLLEVNTIPGMTSHSLVPKAAAQAGLDYAALVAHILKSAAGGGEGSHA